MTPGVSALFGRLPSAVEINVRPRFGMNWWPVQKIVWWSVPLCGSMGLELCYGLFLLTDLLLLYCIYDAAADCIGILTDRVLGNDLFELSVLCPLLSLCWAYCCFRGKSMC